MNLDPNRTAAQVYANIAANLRQFGYKDISGNMIREIHEAINAGDEELPHGIIGMFAKDQIQQAKDIGFLS